MFGLLKNLLVGKSSESAAKSEPATTYEGFEIVPCPRDEGGGWTTEATITKTIDGELRTHHFIRADKTGSRDGAIELILNKSRQTIDQLGERIFS
ncbi:MAG: HlyU family transcriptional regulator [bacterium]